MSAEVIHSRQFVPQEMDLLVVLGKNLGVDWGVQDIRESRDYLSIDSRISTLAAGELYVPGRVILFSGGRTTGNGFPSQPEAAKRYLHRRYPNISPDDVRLDENGFDTAASAESSKRIIEAGTYGCIGLISVGYHIKNAAKLFERYGTHIDIKIASEGILAERSRHHNGYLTAWKGLDRVKRETNIERARALALNTIDRKGRLVRRHTVRRVTE